MAGELSPNHQVTTKRMIVFFFQAEDGIRDYKVTGVQTCALPIYPAGADTAPPSAPGASGQPRKVIAISPVQQKYLEHFSFQCGYCTPGFVIAATVLVERLAKAPIRAADVEQVVGEALQPHLCRCTGYVRYYAAVKDLVLNTPGLTLKG